MRIIRQEFYLLQFERPDCSLKIDLWDGNEKHTNNSAKKVEKIRDKETSNNGMFLNFGETIVGHAFRQSATTEKWMYIWDESLNYVQFWFREYERGLFVIFGGRS
jgi:hypothetical protein